MKIFFRKTLALFLALSLILSLGLSAAASDAMGEDLTALDTLLHQETQLSSYHLIVGLLLTGRAEPWPAICQTHRKPE